MPQKPWRSIRLKGFDYSQPGSYFVTICTFDRKCLFGEVMGDQMKLNGLGELVNREWTKTAELRKNVKLDAFIVMPNHLHGIITLVEEGITSEAATGVEAFEKPTSNSVPTIVRLFKAATTKQINLLRGPGNGPVWQRN